MDSPPEPAGNDGLEWGMTVLLSLTLLVLPGCFLAPTYKRPPVDTPPAFKEAAPPVAGWKTATPKDAFPRGAWWELFGDPRLNALEQKLTVSNQNVQQAMASYREARALVKEVQAAYFPTVGTVPSITRERLPPISTSGLPNSGTSNTVNLFDLPVTAAWEPDLFGAVTFAVRTAKAEAQASAAQLQGILLSMQGELASDYFALQEIDMQTTVLNTAADSYEKFLQLTKARYGGGVASLADVEQAQTQLDQTRAQATDLGIARAQNEHAIAVLLGQAPSTFSLPPGRIQSAPPPIPTVLPSDLLERRPDIASAERLIVAANGQIGLARAAYFPTISLTATGGYESNTWSSWFTWPQRFWSIGASAADTLLDFGRRSAVSQQAHAIYDAQVAAYRQTVLAAFEEVEDNLASLRLLEKEAGQQDSAVKAAEQSLNLEVLQYKAGTVSYLNVITTQDIALTNEIAATQIMGRRMAAAVTLILAVGGGWDISQLPWPHNLESLPKPSTTPLSALAPANPPAPTSQVPPPVNSPVAVSSAASVVPSYLPVAISTTALAPALILSSGPAIGIPMVVPVSTPGVASPSTPTVSPSTPTLTH
jgi:NodT family efflux transporter outer membrane factor (OMF) lipoprotein